MKKIFYILLLCISFVGAGCGKEASTTEETQKDEHISTSTNESEPICETGHKEDIIIGKTATCMEAGLTDGKKCSVCGVVTVEQTKIAATGHVYTDDVDLECNDCGYVRGYWSDWIDNGNEPVLESNLREIEKREVNASSMKYRYKRCIWYSSSGVFSSSKRPPYGYTEGTIEKGSMTYSWDYSDWCEEPIAVEYKYYDGVTATETYVSDGITYYEEVEEVAEVEYRYSRCIWYSDSGIFSSSKMPPFGYTEGVVAKGSKTYRWDYSDWYDAPVEVKWVTYEGYSTATSTYNCDGTTYYNEEIGNKSVTETHYFYRDIIFY